MPINPDKFWTDMAAGLRRKLGLAPPATPEEAEAQYEAAEEVPLTENQIDRIVGHACGGEPPRYHQPSPGYEADKADLSHVEDDMLVLNRNAGDEDPEIQARKQELRKKALEKRRARQQKENQDGLAGGGEPPSESG